ncbi:MAG: hypothetical protein KF833_05450 [Verrucomicrobiae bacterium]|nr:hypothetical protein [Verrucomicrobiae bacterium]
MNLRALCLGLGCLLAGALSAPSQEPDAGVLYLDLAGDPVQGPRGWPWPFVWYVLNPGTVPDTLVVEGSDGTGIQVSAVTPGRWWLSPAQTLDLPTGPAVARLGQAVLPFDVVDRPTPLTPHQEEARHLVRIRHLLALGPAAEAQRLAGAWLAEQPDSVLARTLLADALAAQGRARDALASYQTVLDVQDWNLRPPHSLLLAVNAAWEDVVATLPLAPPYEPEPVTLEEQDRAFGEDPNGQWAATVTASSEYQSQGDYSASRAAGPPDVTRYGDSRFAWASRTADGQEEWLDATFARAVHATAVRVRQVFNVGAISRIEVFDPAGVGTTVFSGSDTNAYTPRQIAWFIIRFPTTGRPVQRVRITLDSPRVRGWNEIDAIQLVGTPPTVERPTLSYTWQSESRTLHFAPWPEGFVLERATRLAPPDWQPLPEPAPVRIPLTGEPAFFRLVRAQ